MPDPVVADASIFIKAPADKTFALALGFDAPAIVRPQGLLPGVRSVAGTIGAWSKAGQQRTLTLTDGSSVEETLIEVGPASYRYRVANFSGPFKFLVKEANAAFAVEPRQNGSTLIWTYEFAPTSALAAPIVSLIASSFWTGWMDAALERLKDALELQ